MNNADCAIFLCKCLYTDYWARNSSEFLFGAPDPEFRNKLAKYFVTDNSLYHILILMSYRPAGPNNVVFIE